VITVYLLKFLVTKKLIFLQEIRVFLIFVNGVPWQRESISGIPRW